jgi:CDGSH-type Zn-finger protein
MSTLRAMSEQTPQTPTVITVGENGPNMVVGSVEIRNAAGELVKTAGRVALCRCGASENKPFCDGSHKRIGFTDPGPSASPAG